MFVNSILIGLAIFFCLSLFAVLATLGYWVYQDAKVRSDKPGIWALIAIVTPNLFGLIIYLLVGRTKPGKSDRKYKIPLIISICCTVLVFSVLCVGIIGNIMGSADMMPNISIGQVQNTRGDSWRVSFKSSGDTLNRTASLNQEELENFYVSSECDEGKITLVISQNDIERIYDISNFDGCIDLSGDFSPDSRIRLTIDNENAKNGKIVIEWR